MHPILSDNRKFIIYQFVWGVIGALLGAELSVFNQLPSYQSMLFTLPMLLLLGQMNLSAWYVSKAFPLDRTPLWKVLIIAAAFVVFLGTVWTLAGWGIKMVIESTLTVPLSPLSLKQSLFVLYVTAKPFSLAMLALSYLISAFERTKESERMAYEARIHAQNAELKALRMQIDPHFLFNSLNSISALTSVDAALARTMTTKLADFFRKSLSYGAKESISFKEELSLTDDYLSIERIRFGKRLSVEQIIDPSALTAVVPPLLLQPLLENAIKHGIAGTVDGGTITITAETKSDRLFVTVENPVDGDAPQRPGAGMGLEILRRRLQTIYGEESGLIKRSTDGRFTVILFLPVRNNA